MKVSTNGGEKVQKKHNHIPMNSKTLHSQNQENSQGLGNSAKVLTRRYRKEINIS